MLREKGFIEGSRGILGQNFAVGYRINLKRGRLKINAGGVQGINLDGTILADWSLPVLTYI
jgi:hypothetical protein